MESETCSDPDHVCERCLHKRIRLLRRQRLLEFRELSLMNTRGGRVVESAQDAVLIGGTSQATSRAEFRAAA